MRQGLPGWFPRLGERGNVALMTAIFAPLLLLVGGFAVDYGYSSYLGQRLTQATDNAVLASVSQSAATAGGGFGNTAWLQAYGTNVFNSNIADLPITGVKFNLQVTPNGSLGVNSVGSYTYDNPTFFAGIMGIPKISMNSTIKASANPVTYIDYYILVDVSQSMGIGATQSDMNALYQRGLTYGAGAFPGSLHEPSCVFGCHVRRQDQDGSMTNEQIAHSVQPYINLRVDSAVSAIQSIISDAQTAAGTNKNIRIGIYTINKDPTKSSKYYNVISPPSSDYSTLIQLATAIDLGNNVTSSPSADSDFVDEFASFATQQMPASNGSGASAVSPKNYIFIVTDGLSNVGSDDSCYYYQNNNCSSVIKSTDCDVLKPHASVGVIYTTYIPIYKNNDQKQGLEPIYGFFVAPFMKFDSKYNITYDPMWVNLQSCSSDASKFAFQASDGPAINTQMRALFASTLQNARLTQ